MTHLQHRLNSVGRLGVLPIFAFANAGIPLRDGLGEALCSPVTWGVMAGLFVGKPVGIALFTWLAVRLGIAIKPGGIAWRHRRGGLAGRHRLYDLPLRDRARIRGRPGRGQSAGRSSCGVGDRWGGGLPGAERDASTAR